jgi:hypothetical protein
MRSALARLQEEADATKLTRQAIGATRVERRAVAAADKAIQESDTADPGS